MDDWRRRARLLLEHALRTKDQPALTFTLVQLTAYARADDIEAFAKEVLDTMDHDVQVWWRQECNCDGHQN